MISTTRTRVRHNSLPCPVCGTASQFAQLCRDAALYRCEACDHCFSDPESVQTTEHYGPEYYEKNWFQNANKWLFETLGQMISSIKEDASVADVGCGNGAFLKYLHRTHPKLRLTGIDLSPNEPHSGINFIQGDAL